MTNTTGMTAGATGMTHTPDAPGPVPPPVPTTIDEAVEFILRASGPVALFGRGGDTPEACLRAGRRAYRTLARTVHPDAVPADRRPDAQAAFTRLGHLWERYQREIAGETAGRRAVVTTRKHVYSVGKVHARGDIATLSEVTYAGADPGTGGTEVCALLKIPRSVADNDLMEREVTALRRLAREGEDRFAAYVPRLVETFRHRDGVGGGLRRANVIERVHGFRSLAEVRAVCPDGLDARDVAWMWRRLLAALGYAHRAGIVHGAVVPDHVLIHPHDHGLVLVDWCYSVVTGTDGSGGAAGHVPAMHVPAMVDRFVDMYPPEVAARRPPDAATDIYLATMCMTYLLRDDAPRPILRFARGCTLPGQSRRPHDAWRLLGELDELLERLYGPRRFRPLRIPTPDNADEHP
ncbi:lipopolysaccharide kinase InaA family protein [Candidatus Protofrankia californiensis]|uniref:lipopolysaccharide kinase InaA family protein n=1 Tax=Candidatus Protofrankia californiensis TaxID=1839754 RepID=UPI001F495AED|nr:lipopolysaccharide kinase InaA family protein [Candidatus Protofrankia californiensis]